MLMKYYHWIMILVIAVAAAFLLWKRHELRGRELALSASVMIADKSVSRQITPDPQEEGARTKSAGRIKRDSFDPEAYVAKLNAAIATAPADAGDRYLVIMTTVLEHGDDLNAASLDTLKEACRRIEMDGLDPDRMGVWKIIAGLAAKFDPDWTIQQFDRVMKPEENGGNAAGMLKELIQLGRNKNCGWTPGFAKAFATWIESAKSAGRLEGLDAELAPVHVKIALTLGDLPAAAGYLAQAPSKNRAKLADEILQSATSPAARARLIEKAGGSSAAVTELSRALTRSQGFDEARSTLAQANLSAADRDGALLGVASATFGPDTKERANWLLESLSPNQTAAVTEFTSRWTEKDFRHATDWLGTLPPGAVRDAAVLGFLPHAARLDGASATEWAHTISDPELRETAIRSVTQAWMRTEPRSAATGLQQKGIHAETPNQPTK